MSFEATQQERAKRMRLRLEHRMAMALRDSAHGGWRVFHGTAMRDFHDPHLAHFSDKKTVAAWLDGYEAAGAEEAATATKKAWAKAAIEALEEAQSALLNETPEDGVSKADANADTLEKIRLVLNQPTK